MKDILLVAINAKWIHPSLALRLLKANLGSSLENRCDIIEFALRQPLREKTDPILTASPRILGLSVSIWNHLAVLELLKTLRDEWDAVKREGSSQRPVVVLGGPEVSYLPPESEIFKFADYCIRGEGETAFRELCQTILNGQGVFVNREFYQVNTTEIKSGYRLYTDGDLSRKLIYVEASRGCPFRCEFCLSAVDVCAADACAVVDSNRVREFPLETFLSEMEELIQRGAKTFKFLDRTFNLNIERSKKIIEFFLYNINEQIRQNKKPFVVHFEMIPSNFPPDLIDILARFPPNTLRLEIGIQTLNPEVSARIGRPSNPEQELKTLSLLVEKTNAILHVDLIAGLPGEGMESFGKGFDALWAVLNGNGAKGIEIQLGILKLLPGAPIARHIKPFGMVFNPQPPYELIETADIPADDMDRIKNFARFWELIVNRSLLDIGPSRVFNRFLLLSDYLFARFGRNWGIDKNELLNTISKEQATSNRQQRKEV